MDDPRDRNPDRSKLRCPHCGSSQVREDAARAERHFTFLACGRCGHGEEIDSLTAASRWKTR